jgi:tetratricopeptide (TPR) repeat protein
MIAPLGAGGTGEVWRADDLVLRTPVALKLIPFTTPELRRRLLSEVRLARQITHSAVCRVFDAGEAEGHVFYSMELVEGQDLATLLRRAGRLAPEKVVDIGLQLCDGLAAAHAQGVLHRDLKPANVLIDEDGRARITDFGIAIARDETGQGEPAGASTYLAPEQIDAGGMLSERTDIHAVGLVLYELATGRPPFAGPTRRSGAPPRPSAIADDIEPYLERAILTALNRDPRRRPASAAALASLLVPAAPAVPTTRYRAWLGGIAVAAIVGLLAVFSSRLQPDGGAALTNRDTLVLADVVNSTGEPVFDGTLKVALAVALEQSPFLKIFPEARVRDTLLLMQHDPAERVTREAAREIAQREQLKALVTGSIGRLGSHYVLALEAVNAQTGDVMAREQIEAAAREEVLTSLGTAVGRLREKLGESLASIRSFDAPLARATTPSLEALHAYSLALDQGRVTLRAEAVPHLQRAIELDPNFAMAQALLSGVYVGLGRFEDAPALSRRAFELRDRVSERERFFISWRYYIDAAQDWDKALDLSRAWTETYPRESFAFNSLGLASAALGQHGRAVDAFRQAIRLDDRFVPPYGNLAGSLLALDRTADARTLLGEAARRGIDATGLRRVSYLLTFLNQDSVGMARELDAARGTASAIASIGWQAHSAAAGGRISAAHDAFQRSIEAAHLAHFNDLAAQGTVQDAELHAVVGDCGAARRETAAGLALGRDNFTLERASRTLALCGDAGASRLTEELAERFADATLTSQLQIPVTAAALALARGEPSRAIALLEPVVPYDHAPSAEAWPAYLRGQAYLKLKDGTHATAQFASIIGHRGEAPDSPLYALAHLGAARAAALQGDRKAARDAYHAFMTLWAGADSNIAVLEQARREEAALP